MAEYCSLDDAFPAQLGAASPGCRGSSAAIGQSREERRRAKKCKGPQAEYFADPDRPSLAAKPGVPDVMRGSGATTEQVNPYNPETGLFEHQPLGVNQIIGASSGAEVRLPSGQSVDELLVPAPKSAYLERKPPKTPAVNTMLRETEGPAQLIRSASKQPPAYFGADLLEDEGFSNFTPAITNEKEYMMSPDLAIDFNKIGSGVGANKASGPALPIPSIVDEWKRLTPAGARSSFIDALPPPGGEIVLGQAGQGQQDGGDLRKKIDQIFARLDDLESAGGGSENNQMEIFLFILSGMMVMFAVDAFARKR